MQDYPEGPPGVDAPVPHELQAIPQALAGSLRGTDRGAGRASPGCASSFASTAVINSSLAGFLKQDCPPTFGSGGSRYRPNNQLENLFDCYFREAGACIPSFAQRNPQSVTIGVVARTLSPVERAFVHAIEGPPDPRSPGSTVPCSTKRFHDELDQAEALTEA